MEAKVWMMATVMLFTISWARTMSSPPEESGVFMLLGREDLFPFNTMSGMQNATMARHKREDNSCEHSANKYLCLPESYSKFELPHIDEVNVVEIGIDISDVLRINDKEYSVTFSSYFNVLWQEPRLRISSRFLKELNHSITSPETLIPVNLELVNDLWLPNIFIYNLKTFKVVEVLSKHAGLWITTNNDVFYSQATHITFICPMRFDSFPLDTQRCKFQVGSYSYDDTKMIFLESPRVKGYVETSRSIVLDYDVRITPLKERDRVLSYGTLGNYSLAGFEMILHRYVSHYIITYYLPSGLFVVVSWISFVVPPDVIPGRMALLITLFLVLVNIFNSVTTNTPKAEGLTAIEAWMLACILFVFGALVEYAVILFRRQTSKDDEGPPIRVRRLPNPVGAQHVKLFCKDNLKYEMSCDQALETRAENVAVTSSDAMDLIQKTTEVLNPPQANPPVIRRCGQSIGSPPPPPPRSSNKLIPKNVQPKVAAGLDPSNGRSIAEDVPEGYHHHHHHHHYHHYDRQQPPRLAAVPGHPHHQLIQHIHGSSSIPILPPHHPQSKFPLNQPPQPPLHFPLTAIRSQIPDDIILSSHSNMDARDSSHKALGADLLEVLADQKIPWNQRVCGENYINVDRFFLIAMPFLFLVFNVVYWFSFGSHFFMDTPIDEEDLKGAE